MSLRWIHETQDPPNCMEECSDIDDSCSEDSYDSDLATSDVPQKNDKNVERSKREAAWHNGGEKNGIAGNDETILWDPRLPTENPIYRESTIKLYCRTGYHLGISLDGRVRGLANPFDSQGNLVIRPISCGVVRIASSETGRYLAFSANGRLYGEMNSGKTNTEWEQWTIGSYDAFRSRKYAELGWWIGIKRNGRPKLGPKTKWAQKAIQFLPIQQFS